MAIADRVGHESIDIAEEFELVKSMDKVVVDTAKTEKDVAGILEDYRVVEGVFADASIDNMIEKLTTEQSLYEDFGEEFMQSFHNNHNDDYLGYIEAGNSFELPTDTDKREYNTESMRYSRILLMCQKKWRKMLSKTAESGLLQVLRMMICTEVTDLKIIRASMGKR